MPSENVMTLLRGSRAALQTVVGPIDLAARLLNNKKGYPSLRLRQSVGSLNDFEGSGGEYAAYLKLLCGLKPEEDLLDIGCGCGLMALDVTGSPLSNYVHNYVGVDINKDAIVWCQEHIKHPYWHFIHLEGPPLPLPNSSFDVILAKSVFTHMLLEEVEEYLRWIKRLLRPGGRCLATFFLLNDVSEPSSGRLTFAHQDGPVSYERETRPRLAVAYEEEWLLDLLRRVGFTYDVHHGSWSGNQSGLSFQDIIILRS